MVKVVGAVLEKDGKIFCAQRGYGKSLAGLWEFPGGKMEAGESEEEALIREMQEEFNCKIIVKEKLVSVVHEYDFGIVELATLLCNLEEGEPQLSEHQDMRWESITNLDCLDWAPADIPTVELLMQRCKQS